MKYALDTEFIDTPKDSQLLSLGVVCEDNRELYLEFPYNKAALTPWLRQHVVPQLHGTTMAFSEAAKRLQLFIGGSKQYPPEFWAYFASYDWYWLCRIFGGMLNMPQHWPMVVRDFAIIHQPVPDRYGMEHHALHDAKSLMHEMKLWLPGMATTHILHHQV